MMSKKLLLVGFLFVLLATTTQAAVIKGTVFDIDLRPVDVARVEIDTTPRQVIVTQDATYSFEISEGVYTLKAQEIKNGSVLASAEETLAVADDGTYRLDLILFPNLETGEDILNETEEIDIREVQAEDRFLLYTGIAIGLLFLFAIIRFFYGKTPERSSEDTTDQDKEDTEDQQSLDKDARTILALLRSEGGRMSQKDLRKSLPEMSESKVSLILTELEHKGEIEKIKKGRSNVVILK